MMKPLPGMPYMAQRFGQHLDVRQFVRTGIGQGQRRAVAVGQVGVVRDVGGEAADHVGAACLVEHAAEHLGHLLAVVSQPSHPACAASR